MKQSKTVDKGSLQRNLNEKNNLNKKRSRKRRVSSRILAYSIARKCHEKKAKNVVIMDMRKMNFITDFFVLCTIVTDRQTNAIGRDINSHMEEKGYKLVNQNAFGTEWVVFDYGIITCHCMTKEKREFYNLESLWFDAPIIKYKWKRSKRR